MASLGHCHDVRGEEHVLKGGSECRSIIAKRVPPATEGSNVCHHIKTAINSTGKEKVNDKSMPLEAPTKEFVRQERLLAFLRDPNSYPHRPPEVRFTQTHSSFVFLTPPFVFKVKKPVDFGFLDYSTLEKRRHFCEREVTLNRRLCPDLYLAVVPISTVRGQLRFGEGDETVEYAVQMRLLSEDGFLDKALERGAIQLRHLDRVAACLTVFYQAQHPTEEIEAWGRIERLRISTDENFRQAEQFIGRTITRPAFNTIRFYTDEFYLRHADIFDSRVRGKWIRDCHGDLHLEHIHLTPRELHIYDCIEFNDRLRYVDVANDIAFLAMDLDHKDRPDLAQHFVTRMASALNDAGMARVINFYKCYRAYVRGKVESLHSIAPEAGEAERRNSAENARRYFRLALRFAVAGSRPGVIAVMGRVGSGKSTLANALAAELDWKTFSSDGIRKDLAGVPLHTRGSEVMRAQLYSTEMTSRTYDKLFASAEQQVQAGRGAILDATFARRAHRDQLRGRFERQGIGFHFIEAQAGDEAIKQRLTEREGRSQEISDARSEDFEMLTKLYEPPTELDRRELCTIPTTAHLSEILSSALKVLAQGQIDSA